MKNIFAILLCVALFRSTLAAQEGLSRHAVYAELGGPGLLYSLNYERRVGGVWSIRGGASVFAVRHPEPEDPGHVYAILPLSCHYLRGEGSHLLDLGAGPAVGWSWNESTGESVPEYLISLHIGYRFQPRRGGVSFQAAFTPFLFPDEWMRKNSKFAVYPWFGIGVGYGFKL